jgi:RimJ/RimL family protein N-acetyltransferase
MFARTPRLLLRPGWIEDAPALADAIDHETVRANLTGSRWPVDQSDAERWLKRSHDPRLPSLLVVSRTNDSPRLVGGAALHPMADGTIELDFWIIPNARRLGFATEAGQAMLGIAHALGLGRLTACVFGDDGPAVRVLEKLGFAVWDKATRRAAARDAVISATRFVRRLDLPSNRKMPLLAA